MFDSILFYFSINLAFSLFYLGNSMQVERMKVKINKLRYLGCCCSAKATSFFGNKQKNTH